MSNSTIYTLKVSDFRSIYPRIRYSIFYRYEKNIVYVRFAAPTDISIRNLVKSLNLTI